MGMRTCEIDESKIAEAVKFAISSNFDLDDLSRLLVLEGGVDLDALARIISENRPQERAKPFRLEELDQIGPISSLTSPSHSDFQMTIDSWFGLKAAY